jgi:hypothetical protein
VNKNLYDTKIEFPSHMRKHMRICFSKVENPDKTSKGYKRNEELQNQHSISYKQLKRIKNFFDNFKGNQEDESFILNGGFELKNWVENELRRMREGIYLTKRNKMDTGMQNQFIDSHEKKDFTNVRPSKEHSRTVDKYNAAVTESLRRINEIISKL